MIPTLSEDKQEKAKEIIEITKKMLRKNIDIPDIIEIIDLDKNKIEELKMNIEY